MVSPTMRTIGAWVAAYRLLRSWVDAEAQLLPMWEVPIKVADAVGDEVNAVRSKKWERVGQERSRDSRVSAFPVNDEQ